MMDACKKQKKNHKDEGFLIILNFKNDNKNKLIENLRTKIKGQSDERGNRSVTKCLTK